MIVPAKCTQCNAPIKVEDSLARGKCEYCGAQYITKEAISFAAKSPAVNNNNYAAANTTQTTYSSYVHSQHKRNKTIGSVVAAVVVVVVAAIIFFNFILPVLRNSGNNSTETPTSTTHGMNERVVTDWFNIKILKGTLYGEGIGAFGILGRDGKRLCVIRLELENFTLEDCDMAISNDFFVEMDGLKYSMENKGGSYSVKTHEADTLFPNMFIIPPGETFDGWVAFFVPASPTLKFTFIYEEHHFEGDTRLGVKNYYRFPLQSV